MLDDKPRKLLTILWNFRGNYGRVPSIEMLVHKLRWNRKQVLDSLQVLSDRGLIVWDRNRHQEMIVLKSSELDFVQANPKHSNWLEFTP